MSETDARGRGRPSATSHAAIERAAFRLFADQGFERTTLADVAREVGVGERTIFRYYPSKNDIPWGRFDDTLNGFRSILTSSSPDLPLCSAVVQAVIAFNDVPDAAMPFHRQRMHLILSTPALQAHSVLRYAEWRRVIAEYAAARLGTGPDDLEPRVLGHTSLALALAAYEVWLEQPGSSLTALLEDGMESLAMFWSRRHPRDSTALSAAAAEPGTPRAAPGSRSAAG